MAACLLLSGCAKDDGLPTNGLAKKQYTYWLEYLKKDHPEYLFTPIGGYSTLLKLQETPGDASKPLGEPDGYYKYVRVSYVNTDDEGNYIGYTSDTIAKQLGVYDRSVYCGPEIIYRGESNVYAGLDMVLSQMCVGGRMKYVSPGWLNTYNRQASEQAYLDKETGTHIIGDIVVLDRIHNVITWEVDSVCRYVKKTYDMSPADSIRYGMYTKTLVPPKSWNDTLEAGTVVYINYIGRLLNGQVFDTTIADTAKKYGIFNESASYGPVTANYAKKGSDVTLGGSDGAAGSKVVEGFGTIISRLHKNETLRGVFYSGLGYEYEGSKPKIPPFCPLEFDVEYVEK